MAELSDKQVLKNAFPKWIEGGGIFASMEDMPWNTTVDGIILDIEYFGNRSGLKFCSPLIYNFLDDDGAVTDNGVTTIARVLKTRYGQSWAKLWETYVAEYDPLNNYDISETEHRENTGTDNYTDTHDLTDSHTTSQTNSGTVTVKQTGTDTVAETSNGTTNDAVVNSRHGFNGTSETGVPVTNQTSKNTSTNTNNTTDTKDLTNATEGEVTNTGTDTTTSGGTESRDRDTSLNEDITRSRKGIIGIARQDALAKEREVWMWDYFGKVFYDTDQLLTLAIFDPCKVQSTGLYTGGSGQDQYVLPVATNGALGGVRAPSKTTQTVPVAVDSAGYLYVPTYPAEPEPYTLPIATDTVLGGVTAKAKTEAETQEVAVDMYGKLWTPPGSVYTLPVMTENILGGGLAIPKSDDMTQEVGVDSSGKLWVPASGGSSGTEPFYIVGSHSNTSGQVTVTLEPVDIDKLIEVITTGSAQVIIKLKYSNENYYRYYPAVKMIYNDTPLVGLPFIQVNVYGCYTTLSSSYELNCEFISYNYANYNGNTSENCVYNWFFKTIS